MTDMEPVNNALEQKTGRRRVLKAAGATGASLLSAGCIGGAFGGPGNDQNTDTAGSPTENSTPTATDTATATTNPGPTYIRFTPTVNEELRNQIPEEHVEELKRLGFNFDEPVEDSIAYTDPTNIIDGDFSVKKIGFDPLGMRALHHNDYQAITQTSRYMPEAEIHVKAALGKEGELTEEQQAAVERAKKEDPTVSYDSDSNVRGDKGSWYEEEGINAETTDEFLDDSLDLYTNIEEELDEGLISTEDAKQAAVLEEIADLDADLGIHAWPLKMDEGGHGFILLYSRKDDKIFGIDTARNGVVEDLHDEIEKIRYEEEKGWNEPWQWEPGEPDDFAIPMMNKIVTNDHGNMRLTAEERSTVAVTPKYFDHFTDQLAKYNIEDDTEFTDIYDIAMQRAAAMKEDGMYALDVTEEGKPFAREVYNESTLKIIRAGEVEDIRQLSAGA